MKTQLLHCLIYLEYTARPPPPIVGRKHSWTATSSKTLNVFSFAHARSTHSAHSHRPLPKRNTAQPLFPMGPLQLAIHVVQNRRAGKEKSHWDKTDKGNYHLTWAKEKTFNVLLLVAVQLCLTMRIKWHYYWWRKRIG